MGLFSSTFGASSGPISVSDEAGWTRILGPSRSAAGVEVSESSAMGFSPFYACTKVLAETIAQLPRHIYREKKSGTKEPAFEHPSYSAIHNEANPHMSSFIFFETMQAHLGGWGNAYAEIEQNGKGQGVHLWPLLPDRTGVQKKSSESFNYQTTIDGKHYEIPYTKVLHVPGLGFDGYSGYSFVQIVRQAVGLGLAMESFGSKFFAQGAQSGVALIHPRGLSPEARANIREEEDAMNGGLSNAHRFKVFQEGITIQQLGIPPEDAQFLETRKFQIAEVARFFRIPLHKLQEMDRATFSNIEQQSIEFITDTMMPWVIRWEQELNRKLFPKSERGQFFVKFNVNALLRGDAKARSEFYAKAVGRPWMSMNEARAFEDMNPVENGDEIAEPMNMNFGDKEDDREAEDGGDDRALQSISH